MARRGYIRDSGALQILREDSAALEGTAAELALWDGARDTSVSAMYRRWSQMSVSAVVGSMSASSEYFANRFCISQNVVPASVGKRARDITMCSQVLSRLSPDLFVLPASRAGWT